MPRVLILAIVLFVTNVSVSKAEVPALFREPSFNAATLAMAVNHFVAIGEDATVRELAGLAAGKDYVEVLRAGKPPLTAVGVPWLSVHERIGWVCRVLFTPKGQEPLRPPMYGALYLPYASMPPERWPLFPVALCGRTYFVLSQGYTLRGVAEDPVYYIDYCRENGTFRKTPVLVPTREQAMKDAATLRQSEAWKAITWSKTNPADNEKIRDEFIGKFIRVQAESIPTKPYGSTPR